MVFANESPCCEPAVAEERSEKLRGTAATSILRGLRRVYASIISFALLSRAQRARRSSDPCHFCPPFPPSFSRARSRDAPTIHRTKRDRVGLEGEKNACKCATETTSPREGLRIGSPTRREDHKLGSRNRFGIKVVRVTTSR